MKKIILFFFVFISLNAQIYVSTGGNDLLNDGSKDKPIRTIQKAFDMAKSDVDTIYLFGGIYEESISLQPVSSGTDSNYKCLFAVPGELPIIDFAAQEYSSSNRGIKLSKDYWYLKGLEIKNAGDNGIHISGHHNIVENTSLHHNKDTGLQISNGGSHNKIINCDSYLNYDPNSHGENADGFAPKLDIGPGNYFKNCRAYFNSDDGWDCYEGQNQIIIDSCWAFHNGYNVWNDNAFEGDGNGFKLGGNYISAPHIIRNSIAFDNLAKGFDQNHNTSGITVLNCTAFRNERNYVFNENPKDTINFPQDSLHIIKNNISFDGSNSIALKSIEMNNSWNGLFVSFQDFANTDTSLARIPRNEKFNIPVTEFLRLAASSSLIDAGTDVGLPYLGTAPDLGAFEYSDLSTRVKNNKIVSPNFSLDQNHPNPFNPTTVIDYSVPENVSNDNTLLTITVFDMLGRKVETLVNKKHSAGNFQVIFNGKNLSSGIYYYQLKSNSFNQTRKMLLVK